MSAKVSLISFNLSFTKLSEVLCVPVTTVVVIDSVVTLTLSLTSSFTVTFKKYDMTEFA